MKTSQSSKFDFITDIYEKAHTNVERKSFKKLAFLGLVVALGIPLTFSGINTATSYFESQTQQMIAGKNPYVEQIKKIDQEDFNKFVGYLKLQQNIYDEKSSFISEVLTKAERSTNKKDEVSGLKHVRAINEELIDHKKYFEEVIYNDQEVYNNVKIGNFDDLSQEKAKKFLKHFQYYRSNIIYHNEEFEKTLNEKIFTSNEVNKAYNLRFKIIERLRVIDDKMEKSVLAHKPKM